MLTFFTRIPLGKWIHYDEKTYKNGLVTFPLIGFVIGAIISLPFLVSIQSPDFRALIIITLYVFLSGGIHLDGLADSSDGLFSGRERKRILEIMKDPQIGTFGVISLIMYFLFFFVAAKSVEGLWILYMPFVGKTMGYIGASISHYAREDRGMGYVFIEEISAIKGFVMMIIALIAVYLGLGALGGMALVAALLTTGFISRLAHKRIGGQTGDTIGMTIEITQMVFLSFGVLQVF